MSRHLPIDSNTSYVLPGDSEINYFTLLITVLLYPGVLFIGWPTFAYYINSLNYYIIGSWFGNLFAQLYDYLYPPRRPVPFNFNPIPIDQHPIDRLMRYYDDHRIGVHAMRYFDCMTDIDNRNYILRPIPEAHGSCLSRPRDQPPEPPPVLNLGPPPPVHWEESDTSSSDSSFTKELHNYVDRQVVDLERATRLHDVIDDYDDDSYDDEQFDGIPQAQSDSRSFQADYFSAEIIKLKQALTISATEMALCSGKYFSVPPLGINIQYGELGLITLRVIMDLRSARTMYQFVMSILSFYKDLMGRTYLRVIEQFGSYITKCLSVCFDVICNHDNILDLPAAQSENDPMYGEFIYKFRDCLNHYDRLVRSEFANKVILFMSLITLSPFCVANQITFESLGLSELIMKTREQKIAKLSHPSFVFNILDVTCYMAEKLQYIMLNGNLSCIYLDDDEVRKFEEEYSFLKYYEDKLNLLPNHEVTLDTYLKRVDSLQGKLRDIKQFYSKDVAARYLILDYRNGLARMKFAAMDKLKVSCERPLPIGLMLHGPPGIGKSILADQILKICYDNGIFLKHFPNGHVYDKKMKYVLCPEDEFMSEFRINHEVVMMDDVDQFTDKINEAKEGGLIAKAISFVNEIPYITPQAHLEDKGKIPLMAEFIIGTTNSHSAGIETVFKKHSGALRRFFFLDISVKPEFCREGTSALGNKHSSKELLLHDFRLRRYEPIGDKYNEVYFCPDTKVWDIARPRTMDLSELAFVLRDHVQMPHYAQSTSAKDVLDTFMQSELCPKCGITSLLCDCSFPAAQSDFRIIPARVVPTFNYVQDTLLEFLFICFVGMQFLFYGALACIPYYLTTRHYVNISGAWLFKMMNYTMSYPIDTYGALRYPVSRITMGIHFLYLYGCHSDQLFQAMSDVNKFRGIFERHKLKIMMTSGLGLIYVSLKVVMRLIEFSLPSAQSEFVKPIPDENQAKTNPWKQYVTDITVLKSDRASTPKEVLLKLIEYNVCMFKIEWDVKRANVIHTEVRRTNAFGLYSNYLLVPKHWYDEVEGHFPCKVTCYRTDFDCKFGPNRSFWIDQTCKVVASTALDYVIIAHGALGPFRDLRKFMLESPVKGKIKATGIVRCIDTGKIIRREISPLFQSGFSYTRLGAIVSTHGYMGHSAQAYIHGDCGSPVVGELANGVAILGYHIAGMSYDGKHSCYSMPFFVNEMNFSGIHMMAELGSFNGIDLNATYNVDAPLVVLPEAHSKCPSKEVEGVGEIFGSLNMHRRKMKSTVCPTIYENDVLIHYNMLVPDYFSPKEVSSREATRIAIEASANQPSFIPSDVQLAQIATSSIFLNTIDKHDLFVPSRPFDLDVGINGCDGVTYIDRLPVTTSGGFAHRGPKRKHLVDLMPDNYHQVRYGFDEALYAEYKRMYNHYSTSDEAFSIVWDFNLKDEPISAEKIYLNKCRVFNAGPFVFNVLVRQYFLWCVPIFSGKYRHEFGMAIGANVLSEDWTNIYDYVTYHGVNRMIAGDYKAFDKNMPREIMLAAFQVLLDIMAFHGWSTEDLLIARRLASEIICGLYNAQGTLVRLAGNPSGNCLTTIVNSIVNIMYIMIASMEVERSIKSPLKIEYINYNRFFDYVRIVTYGDDNIMSSAVDHINHTSISQALKKFGLEYTMSDKTSVSVPFIHISVCDFLKRRFVPDKNIVGVVAAPLSEKSIIKSLTVCNKSPSINFEEQCASIIDSACREYYQYGEHKFNKERLFLTGLLEKYQLWAWLPRPSLSLYDELKAEQLSNHLDYSFKVRIGLVPPPKAGEITLEKVDSPFL